MEEDISKISPLVRHWMSNAGEEEQERATKNFRNYLKVVYKIFERQEAEEQLKRRDRSDGMMP